MNITFEHAAICLHCSKKGIQFQTYVRIETANANLLRCGDCGWVLPESIKLSVPEELITLVRRFLELSHLRMESPLRQRAAYDLRVSQQADQFVRLESADGSVFCQLIWTNIPEPPPPPGFSYTVRTVEDYARLYVGEPGSTWQTFVDQMHPAARAVFQALIDEGYTTRALPPALGETEGSVSFAKIIGDKLLVQAEMSWGRKEKGLPSPLPE